MVTDEELKAGDWVECIDPGLVNYVTKGKLYCVEGANDEFVTLKASDREHPEELFKARFRKVHVTNTARPSDLPGSRERLTTEPQIESDGSSTDYYQVPEGTRDILDLIEHKQMSFGIGNIFKACYRLGGKHGIDEAYDLRKIIFFAKRRLETLEENTPV